MEIYKQIPKVMAEIGAVGKGGFNEKQNYAFRGIEQFYNAAHPALVKHGVFCAPEVIERFLEQYVNKNGTTTFRAVLTVAHHFYASDGSKVTVTTIGEGNDTSDKACNKAMSAAMKYAFIELFSIPTADVADADKDHVEVETLSQAKTRFQNEKDVPLGAAPVRNGQIKQAAKRGSANEL